jgi:hypothetical protein
MKKYTLFVKLMVPLIILFACKSKVSQEQEKLLKLGIHTVLVQEIINTPEYTYLRLKEIGNPQVKETDTVWVAVTLMEAKNGDTLYYKGGFPMNNFTSKTINRTFKTILFLDNINKTPDFAKNNLNTDNPQKKMGSTDSLQAGKPKITKIDVKIEAGAGITKIGDLYAKKESFKGKSITVKGKVVKFSENIMGKNWVHLQDGTESNGKFDLTITTLSAVKAGDIVTFEGVISLDKDFGYSYFYDVIMEDAKLK